jgi:thiosulfate/3-mercaptopyruvate sulfurtransferase
MASSDGYANPDVLVTTERTLEHRKDTKLRFVEVDVDAAEYDKGHIEGAIGWNWKTQLQDQIRRDILSREQIGKFLGRSGVAPETGIILYGDNNNWFAAYAFWLLKYYGHNDVRLINGGRKNWIGEGKLLSIDTPHYEKKSYKVSKVNTDIRALRDFVASKLKEPTHGLVDVRSADEYTGKNPRASRVAGIVPSRRAYPRFKEHPMVAGSE